MIVNALRVAGADASTFTRFGINAAGLWGDFPPVPDPVPNGSIGVVQTPSGDRMYVYPKDDVVWVILGDDPLVDQVLAMVPGAPDRSALPTPTPVPTPDLSSPEGYLTSLLPATIGDDKLMVRVSGSEAMTWGSRLGKRVLAALKKQGKTKADFYVVQAVLPSGDGTQGFWIQDGDSSPMRDILLREIKDQGGLPKNAGTWRQRTVGGKTLDVITTIYGPANFYLGGGVQWVLSVAEGKLEEFVAALP